MSVFTTPPYQTLRNKRKELGITPSQLSEILKEKYDVDFAIASITSIERGDTRLTVEFLAQCADIFEVPFHELAGASDSSIIKINPPFSPDKALEMLDTIHGNMEEQLSMCDKLTTMIKQGITS